MRVIQALSLLLLAGCQTTGGTSKGAALPDVGGVEQSWAHSQIVIPATRVKSNWPEEIAPWADPSGWQDYVRGELTTPNAKLPAVVYAHGCSGLPANAEFVDFLARLGFAVFAPNSFGRTGRKQHCYQQHGTPT